MGAATLYVKNLEPMRRFYEVLGLAAVDADPGVYYVLESEAWTLALVSISAERAAAIDISDPPARREHTPIKLAFDVAHLDAFRTAIRDVGGAVDPAESEWDFRGFRHCDGVDPEGNILQLRMRLAARD